MVVSSNDDLARTLARDIVATFGPGWSGLDETLADDGFAERVQRFMATSEPLERLYKRARAAGVRISGFKQPDYAYVGLQAPDGAPPFGTLFDALLAPLLAGGRGRSSSRPAACACRAIGAATGRAPSCGTPWPGASAGMSSPST